MKGNCEFCGIIAELVRIYVRGKPYNVCHDCARTYKQQLRAARVRRKIRESKKHVYIIPDAGKYIRKARERKGMTRYDLAPLVGARVSIIRRIENNEYVPSLDLARRFEKVLGIKLVREEYIE